MNKKFLTLLLGAGLVLGACGGGDEDAGGDTDTGGSGGNGGGGDTTAHAEEVLNQSCISCHGQNLEGGLGPALNDVGSRMSEDEIRDIIVNGKGQMPPNLISGEDLDAVVQYLSEQK